MYWSKTCVLKIKNFSYLYALAINTVLRDELDNLDRQRASIEERMDAVKKKKKEIQKAE